MNTKELRSNLRKGLCTIGTWMQIPDASIAEILGKAGYDWVAIDMEHGHFSNQLLPDLFRAIEIGKVLPFVRVAEASRMNVKAALDAGARGIILPMIESAEQLRKAVSWCRYPPEGERGVGYSRASLFGRYLDECFGEASQILIVAQIEHVKAVRDIKEILSVPGLDAIMVGPYDLSASMGLTGQFEHPDFKAALVTLAAACRTASIPSGVHIVQPEPAKVTEAIDGGHQFIAYGVDAVFLWRAAGRPVQLS